MNMIRIAKAIANTGFASRREAEKIINDGRVSVDGEKISSPVFFVNEENIIYIDEKPINVKSEKIRLWKFYKPRGVITTRRDPQGRKTVFDVINYNQGRLLYIGRLDYNSEGLLLFTNNGNVSRYFELPKNKIRRTYRVRVFGKITDSKLNSIRRGIRIDGVNYSPMTISVISSGSTNSWLNVELYEGKNREIRKVFAASDLTVNRLIRTSYGKYKLDDMMMPGDFQEVVIDKKIYAC